ncbi:MAG: outer membrane beta-barrel protein [Bacteroidia bacterium]
MKQKQSNYLIIIIMALVHLNILNKTNAQVVEKAFGIVVDLKAKQPLVGVSVLFIYKQDSTKKIFTNTNSEGKFIVNELPQGFYAIKFSYVGFKKEEISIQLTEANQNLGTFSLSRNPNQLKDVNIQERVIRSQQKGDTTEYNANAFKTNPDANVQDLVTKMPGITIENGTVKAQGENVQKVTIDGKEFFGDDVTLALKNLPAEVVDKIQVFDRQSDQSQFTGFNDGNTQKAINITTKSGKSNGNFGRLYTGAGTNERYTAGGNINFFKGKQRITFLGLSNNINQQNFGSQDLLGLANTGNQGRGGVGGRGFGGGGMMGGQGGGGGNASNNFAVGNQGGINKSNSIGINFSDNWGKKLNFTGSYFFNQSNNNTVSDLQRLTILGQGFDQVYNQKSINQSDNYNHRINLRLEYNLDSSNSIIVTPKLSFQNNNSSNSNNGSNKFYDSLLNTTINTNTSKNEGISLNNNILYRHKFTKQGRTISFNIGTDVNNKNGSTNLFSQNNYYLPNDSVYKLDQKTTTSGNSINHSGAINYTEQIGKNGMLMLNYSPSYSINANDKNTNNKDSVNNEYTILNGSLSSNFENTITTQRGGFNYRLKIGEKTNFMIGANYQLVSLEGIQKTPIPNVMRKNFNNILPGAMISYQFNKKNNVRIFYRTNTNAPSINQLQNVLDNTNPLSLSTGNNNLLQEYSNVLVTRYGFSNPDKGKTFYLFINANNTQNYIGNNTYTVRDSSKMIDNIVLSKGSQLIKPENFDGYWNINSFITYGFPVKMLKSNLNINLGTTYTRTPSKTNNLINYANTYTLTSGFALGSNINEKIDFTISYTAFYNVVENTLNANANNNYFYQISAAKLNLMLWKGLIVRTDITNTYYTGLGDNFNQNFFLWSGGFGYKFGKNNAAELLLNTFDIFNQNNNINRTIFGNSIEDNKTQVLNRYFMLVFTYNIRNFKAAR